MRFLGFSIFVGVFQKWSAPRNLRTKHAVLNYNPTPQALNPNPQTPNVCEALLMQHRAFAAEASTPVGIRALNPKP